MADVVRLRGATGVDATSIQFKIEFYQRFIREWMPHLTIHESLVLGQIIDRTVGWGMTEATFTTTRLREGDSVYSGIAHAISRAQMFRVLNSLEEKQFIKRRPGQGGSTVFAINMGWNRGMLNVPKRLRNQSQGETTQSLVETDQSLGETLYTGSHLQVSSTDTVTPSGRNSGRENAEVVRAKIATAVGAHREALTQRAAKTKGSDRSTGVEAAWRAAMIEAFPAVGHVPWNPRLRKNVKDVVRLWTHASQISFEDFAAWAVTNWTAIIAKQFGWMKQKQPPKTPTLAFFLHFVPQFAECWAEGKLNEWLRADERTEVEKLVAKGMTEQEALTEIGARRSAAALRDEMSTRERDAAAKLRRAEQDVQRARKLAEYNGDAVHPRSRRRVPVPEIKVTSEIDRDALTGVPEFRPFDEMFDD